MKIPSGRGREVDVTTLAPRTLILFRCPSCGRRWFEPLIQVTSEEYDHSCPRCDDFAPPAGWAWPEPEENYAGPKGGEPGAEATREP